MAASMTNMISFFLLHLAAGAGNTQEWINVCYFTNWARYRTGLINKNLDVFEMDLDPDLCTHFMYGFGNVVPEAANGGYDLVSFDPNADHPSGSAGQDGLCPDICNDPTFKTNWTDPDGARCDWPCNPTRALRGYEGLNVGMKKKNPSIKSLISVGGWNFNDCAAIPWKVNGQGSKTCRIFAEIAASEEKIKKFAANIITFCRKWGFDGFDLDWEYPVVAGHNSLEKDANGDLRETPDDFANYINMLRILKEEFLAESMSRGAEFPVSPLLLTAAVGVGKSTADTAYDIPQMSNHLDLINLMTYDLHGAWSPRTGCNANLYSTAEDVELEGPASVSWAIDYWLEKGAPAAKLTMGLPTYGRGWILQDPANRGYNAPASGPSTAGASTKEEGYLSYYEIQELLASGAATVYDEERQCPYLVSNGEWIGYDDERSLCAKLEFAKSRGLAGSMVWALDLDDFDGKHSAGQKYPLIRLASEGGSSCSQSPVTGTTTITTTHILSTTMVETTSIAPTTVPVVTTVTTTTAADVSTTQHVTTTMLQPVTSTTLQSNSDSIQSGDTVFLRVQAGTGNHLDVEGSAVQARWKARGHWQAIIMEKKAGGPITSGDTVYLKTHTGAHIDVQGETVQARWEDQGDWQAMKIQKRSGGSGAILLSDTVCFEAHTGKHLDFGDSIARARWNDCGDWQAMLIQKEVDGAMLSGDSIHLLAHTGKRVNVQDTTVQAQSGEAGETQRFMLESRVGGTIFSGDVVFLKAHTGAFIDVEGFAVRARWNEQGHWQQLIIEKKNGGGAIMPGDSVFLIAHTGKMLHVQGDSVQCRWVDRGDWQSFVLEKSALRRMFATSVSMPAEVWV